MLSRAARLISWLLLLTLLSTWLPGAPVVGQALRSTDPPQGTPSTPPDAPTPAAPVPPEPFVPHPALALAVALAPDPLPIGQIATISVTITNRAPYPAENLVVTAPAPEGALALRGPVTVTPVAGWRWQVGHLDGNASAVVTGTLQLVQAPASDAVVASAKATADGLAAPALATGGALALDRTRGPAAIAFTPGTPATLRSQDGRVSVDLPANAATQSLSVRHTPYPLGSSALPDLIGLHRSAGLFALDATDATGAEVHQFAAPLTIAVGYTPEQLRVRGISEANLTLFWFDEAAQRWVPIPTEVDAADRIARVQVDHFTTFALGDGSSASALYIPSLQGFQVSSFTGAASYSIPIETPAGPGGLKPELDLGYSSAATDGSGGERDKWQAGWLGKGWSLGAEGYVARDRSLSGNAWDHFTLVFAGRSLDVVRGQLTNTAGCTTYSDTASLQCWTWHAVDENFTRVRAEVGGSGYIWKAWTKDGARYDFTQALFDRPDPNNAAVVIEPYKWLLTQVTDVHANKIAYTYQVDSVNVGTNLWVHPTYRLSEILWGYDGATPGTGNPRYKASFVPASDAATGTISRWVSDAQGNTTGVDTQWDYPNAPNSYWEQVTPHEKYRLNQIRIYSQQSTTWELVRQYNLFYASADDTTTPNVKTDSINGQAVLTLKSVQRVGNDGVTVLPARSFTYAARGTAQTPNPGANRIRTISNGQGGQLTFDYQNVWVAGAFPNDPSNLYENYHRVSAVTRSNSAGASTTDLTTYTYDTPALNDYDHAATVVYAAYPPSGNGNSRQYLARQEKREFRGHYSVIERHYDGATTNAPLLQETQRWFYQGNGGSGAATCSPALVTLANGSTGVNESDPCYVAMRDREAWKGREFQTQVRSNGSTVLTQTNHSFTRVELPFYGSDTSTASASNNYRRAGLWRVFTAESQTEERIYEGGATPVIKTTQTFYNTNCQADTSATVGYGNVGCVKEFDGSASGALVRTTKRWYSTRDDASSYIVDRMWGETISDGNNGLIALTHQFYDNNSTPNGPIGARGLLTLVRKYYDVPLTGCCTNITLRGQDTAYAYDAYGNATTVTTYAGPGTTLNSTYSGPGNGSAARSATTAYDSVFHAFPVQETNALGHISKADYDERMGTLIRVTGPNSSGGAITDCSVAIYSVPTTEETSCAQYDVFGRMLKLIKPGDSSSYPTVQATYYDSEQPFRYRFDQRESAGGAGVRVDQQFYDGLGRTIQEKREGPGAWQNIVVDSRYDGLDRLVAQSQARYSNETSTTFWQYTAPGSGALYNQTTTTYDGLGRPLVISAPGSRKTEHHYGVQSDGTFGMVRYDDVIDPNRHRTQQNYDALGWLVRVYELSGDCAANYWQPTYSCTAPYTTPWAIAATTTYNYTALDLLNKVTDQNNNVTTIAYDSLGRKTSMSDPDTGAWSYGYDANGNLIKQTDARGVSTRFTYDALNRLTTRHPFANASGPSGTTPFYRLVRGGTYLYTASSVERDNAVAQSGYAYEGIEGFVYPSQAANTTALYRLYNGSDYLYTISSAERDSAVAGGYTYEGVAAYVYSSAQANTTPLYRLNTGSAHFYTTSAGERTSYTLEGIAAYLYAAQAVYTYDGAGVPNGQGRRTTMAGPTATTNWQYTARGQISRATQTTVWLSGGRVFQWSYDSAERVSTLIYPSGEALTTGYDAAWRPYSLCTSLGGCYVSSASYTALEQPGARTDGSGVTQSWSYESTTARLSQLSIGSAFNRSYAYDSADNLTTITDNLNPANSQSFGYDARDRLTSWTLGGTPQSYSYDPLGNLTSKAGTTIQYGGNLNGSGAGPHQARNVGGAAYSYDANGNLASGGGWSYTWNADNTLASLSNGTAPESYSYDADDERVARTAGGATTIYLQGLQDETTAGSVSSYYIFNGEVVAQRTSAGVTYLHGDHLGSVSVTTGAVASQQEFDPWGNVRSGSIGATTLNYTGQRLDASGLLYYHARYYNPVIARFVSADTLIPEPTNPQALNRYAYVHNNPLNHTDATGHCLWDACILEGAAIVALAVGVYAWGSIELEKARQDAQVRIQKNRSGASGFAPISSDRGGNTANPIGPPEPTPGPGGTSSTSSGSSYRANYEKFYKVTTDSDYQVHHILPQRFREILARASQGRINVDDPRWLREVRIEDPTTGVKVHQRLYTEVWQNWARELGRQPTAKEIIQFARQLEGQYATEDTLFYRQGARLPGRVDWDTLLKLLRGGP